MNETTKIIVFDEETSPMKGYFFGTIWETNIVGEVIEYETIITISYWDSVTGKIKNISQWDFDDWKAGVWNDKSLIAYFREILLKYDIIAGQNSDQFDIKLFNARLAYWGFDPLPDYKTLDTKKIAKSKLKLPSYSLEFMANFFGLGGKYHHSGLDMWFQSRDGDRKAQKEMVHYCNIDVMRTKDVLLRLLPFMKHTQDFMRDKNLDLRCSNPNCLSSNLGVHDRKRRVVGGYRLQYQCKDCGSYTTDTKKYKFDKK